jgi:serine/threonine protein kinase
MLHSLVRASSLVAALSANLTSNADAELLLVHHPSELPYLMPVKYRPCADFSDITFTPHHGSHGILSYAMLDGMSVVRKRYQYKDLRSFYREATLLHRAPHPNLLRLLAWSHDGPGLFLVLERHAVLSEVIRSLDMAQRRRLCLQLARVMAHLHTLGIIHADPKLDNLLIKDDSDLCLCDLSLGKVCCVWTWSSRGHSVSDSCANRSRLATTASWTEQARRSISRPSWSSPPATTQPSPTCS